MGGKADGVSTEQPLTHFVPVPRFGFGRFWRRTRQETGPDPGSVEALRDALAREEILLRRAQSLAEEYETLRDESDHRLLNGLQMVVSLLMMQSRAAAPDVAVQLAAAARRVKAIERIHRRLHINDGTKTVAFKKYLETFCKDFSGVMADEREEGHNILVECDEISLPTVISIPLGFIINELITNAIKYGKGNIRVRLEGRPNAICALIISNDGPALPESYDPAASKGLGMKIVQSFVLQIGGEFQFGRGENNQGAQFTVLFPHCHAIDTPQAQNPT
jgi:two-component system, sensor histidine kinase PdtaS